MAKINISIPKPCHENWQNMLPDNKGRFCLSCQKNVFDFTKATDGEIVAAFQHNQNLCGRFLKSQLNRDLIKPEKKSKVWLATTSALISFIGLGNQETLAQEEIKTEQTDKKVLNITDTVAQENILVAGIVYDENKRPIPHIGIYLKGVKIGETNENGNFSITTHLKSRIVFRYAEEDDYDGTDYYVKNNYNNNIEINKEKKNEMIMKSYEVGRIQIKKRTFFGRVLHAIGNLFR